MKLWIIIVSILLGVAVLVFVLGGCATQEQDLAVYGVWAKRGQALGRLAQIYCEQGSQRARSMMEWSMERTQYPARVKIACLNKSEE